MGGEEEGRKGELWLVSKMTTKFIIKNSLLNIMLPKLFSGNENISYLSESQKMLSTFHNKKPNKKIVKDV